MMTSVFRRVELFPIAEGLVKPASILRMLVHSVIDALFRCSSLPLDPSEQSESTTALYLPTSI